MLNIEVAARRAATETAPPPPTDPGGGALLRPVKARRRLGASFHSNEQIRGAPPARARKAVKRGGGHVGTAIDVALWLPDEKVNTVTELDEALGRLEILDARQSRMLELR